MMPCSPVSFCFMSCSGSKTLSVKNLTHSKEMFLTFLFNNLFQELCFLGVRKERALFLFKYQRVNNENKFSVPVQALIRHIKSDQA